MKRTVSLLLCIIIAFSFAGCSEFSISDLAEIGKGAYLSEIDLSDLKNSYVVDFDANDRYVVILYDSFPNTEEDAAGDSYLAVYDSIRKRITRQIEVDEFAYHVEIKNNSIQMWYGNKSQDNPDEPEKSMLYDFKLKKLGIGKGNVFNCYDVANNIKTIDSNRFACLDDMCYDTKYLQNDVIVFYDDPKNYYFKKYNNKCSYLDSVGKKVLESISSEGEKRNINLNVNDYSSATTINTLSIETNKNYDCVNKAKINEYCVCFDTCTEDGKAEKIYKWNYNKNSKDTPIDINVVNDSEYSKEVENITKRIKKEYGIELKVNPEYNDFYSFQWKNNEKNVVALLTLYDIEYSLSTMPKDVYKQMLCNDIKNPIAEFNKFYIYVVGEFIDDLSAFASNKNDDLYIIYSCSGFNYMNFCHEMFHNMEYRIWNYSSDFEEKWEKLNPKGFEYDDNYSEKFYGNELYENYFTRDYGTKSQLEDRATVFETMCDAKFCNSERWWEERKPLSKKVALIDKTLKKSFPAFAEGTPW